MGENECTHHISTIHTLKLCLYKPADVILQQQSGLIIKDDSKGELNKIGKIQMDVLQNGNCCTFLL